MELERIITQQKETFTEEKLNEAISEILEEKNVIIREIDDENK